MMYLISIWPDIFVWTIVIPQEYPGSQNAIFSPVNLPLCGEYFVVLEKEIYIDEYG